MDRFCRRNSSKNSIKHFSQKCCGCCKWYGRVETIAPECCEHGFGGDGITVGLCAISGCKAFNTDKSCKQWIRKAGVVIDENHEIF